MIMEMSDFCEDKMISIKKSSGIPLNRKIIFLCTSPRDVRSTISLVLDAINLSKSNPFLVIKLHPRAIENKINFIDYGFRKSKDYIIISEHINQFMLISDVVVSQLSTVALESVLVGKPHIIISKDLSLKNSFIFKEKPLIMYTDNHNEAAQMLDKILLSRKSKEIMNENRGKFLKNYFDNIDGCALERVNDFLVNL
jgi:CDP-glycerol glycerophosphotransferase (TagB/SpsB family)